jgi:hypothetical protein
MFCALKEETSLFSVELPRSQTWEDLLVGEHLWRNNAPFPTLIVDVRRVSCYFSLSHDNVAFSVPRVALIRGGNKKGVTVLTPATPDGGTCKLS